MGTGYTLLDHTADVGLRAWGPTPAAAFAEAARGMFAIMLGEDPSVWSGDGDAVQIEVEASGEDWSEVLVNWLAELLFHFEVDGLVVQRIDMEHCEPPYCLSRLHGLRLHDPAAAQGVAVKAVTYHQLQVAITENRTEVQVIFDI